MSETRRFRARPIYRRHKQLYPASNYKITISTVYWRTKISEKIVVFDSTIIFCDGLSFVQST